MLHLLLGVGLAAVAALSCLQGCAAAAASGHMHQIQLFARRLQATPGLITTPTDGEVSKAVLTSAMYAIAGAALAVIAGIFIAYGLMH